jgi:hypothetical protein
MRQSNGVALFGPNDPRGATIGIIEVASDDDRQSILTAILTQEKLGRKETVVVLPEQSEAFRRPPDFKEFESTLHDLQTHLVFVLPAESNLTRVVRQHQYPVFVSLDNYAQYARQFLRPPSSNTPSSEEDTSDTDANPSPEPPVTPVVPDPAPPADDESTVPHASTSTSKRPVPQPLPPDEEEDEEETEAPTQPASPIPLRASLFGRPTAAVSPLRNAGPSEEEETVPSTPSTPPLPSQTSSSPRRRLPRLRWTLIVLVLVVLLVLGGVLGTLSGMLPLALVFPGITSATVTITPDSKVVQQSYQIAAVTTLADSAQRQVQARFLSSTTTLQTKTIPATGSGSYPARHAVGELIFYNALPQAQDVPKGTVVTDDQGIEVISDQDALIPAAQLAQQSNQMVPAHALLAGVRGNAFHLDTARSCCHPGVSVVSSGDFQGGQDASTYTYVQQSDIDTATTALMATLMDTGQNALKKQVAPSEQMVGTAQCVPDTISDHAAGEQAKTVTVSVQVTCTGEVYDQQATQQLAEYLLKADVEKQVGPSYTLLNRITTTVSSIQKKDASGTLQLQVSASGLWSYQFGDAQKATFARLITGQKADQAVKILLQQPGVHNARINLFLAYNNTLPADPHQITVIWQPTS